MAAQVTEAEADAIAVLTAAAADNEHCAVLATEVALRDVDHRILVAFCVLEACWSWAPPDADSVHPVAGPALEALRAGDEDAVRALLLDAMTGRQPGSYAALLVQLAYIVADLVDDLPARLPHRGLTLAANPAAAGDRRAGPA